jgi:WD40 repeat protein
MSVYIETKPFSLSDWQMVPNEINQKIFLLLPFQSVLCCRLTCKHFQSITSHTEGVFWQTFYEWNFVDCDSLDLEGKSYFARCKAEYIYRSNVSKGLYLLSVPQTKMLFRSSECVAPVGKSLVAVGDARGIKIIDDKGNCCYDFPSVFLHRICSLVFSGQSLFAGYSNGAVWSFDVNPAEPGKEEKEELSLGNVDGVTALTAFDKTVISGSLDGTIKVWDREAKKCTATFDAEGQVSSFAVAEKMFAVGFFSEKIKLYMINMRKEPECLHQAPYYFFNAGARTTIAALVFDEQRERLISAAGWEIKLWDVQTKQCIKTIKTHTVASLYFAAGCVVSFSKSLTEVVKIWDPEAFTCTTASIAGYPLLSQASCFIAGKIFICKTMSLEWLDFTASDKELLQDIKMQFFRKPEMAEDQFWKMPKRITDRILQLAGTTQEQWKMSHVDKKTTAIRVYLQSRAGL